MAKNGSITTSIFYAVPFLVLNDFRDDFKKKTFSNTENCLDIPIHHSKEYGLIDA
jgi:hypothetical protein